MAFQKNYHFKVIDKKAKLVTEHCLYEQALTLVVGPRLSSRGGCVHLPTSKRFFHRAERKTARGDVTEKGRTSQSVDGDLHHSPCDNLPRLWYVILLPHCCSATRAQLSWFILLLPLSYKVGEVVETRSILVIRNEKTRVEDLA